ncbi:hypothetical protein BH11PSE8_BH11PSE8_42890 [soil metagenome]
MKRIRIALSSLILALAASAAFALPTVAEVQAEVQKGNFSQAQTMMREVVTAKPGSAKAHYIYAEILAHNARFDEAAQETRLARQLDPAIKFTQADKFRAFEQMLDREQQNARAKAAASTAAKPVDLGPTTLPQTRGDAAPRQPSNAGQQIEPRQSGGVPGWAWGLGIAAIAFVGWRMLSRGRSAAPMQQPMATSYGPGATPYGANQGVAPYGANPAYPPGGGYGPTGMAPSAGGGLMGVGLAAAGGVAAGMLAEKFMERGREAPHENNISNIGGGNGGGMFDRDSFAGGSQGLPDADARALESRDVDFGSGSDWTDAGSFDSGSSGGSDDW